MTPTEKIDAALHAVLQARESSDKEKMREAMRKIMADSYIDGVHAAQDPRMQSFLSIRKG